MFAGSSYAEGLTRLDPGDAVLMYSDGITEAESPDGTPFDEAGLERTLAPTRPRPPERWDERC